ncbi:MAG: hydroxyacid dehydrogenase [Candidatus Pacebacteria bacterium CG_4_10_14_0_8_um_filter_42_14]|nr:MAG: hydroxyacid dehydrogenase [Candidatus Pacebacteria bacterium CG_4_10_14_0_8_um_filter_42_14]
MNKKKQKSQIIIYKTATGETKIDVRFEDETVWLSQAEMARLFDKGRSTITEHISNVFKEKELVEKSVCREFRRTGSDGKRYSINFYNLEVIISVGYRVKSLRGTQFRQWATAHLREYIVKGFVLDDERLKNPDLPFDYFEELTRRIQDIRTSEKRFYRKITDIYATSVDYDPTAEQSILFFKTVQNKVHYAITGKTAAEIIASRVDSKKPNSGLTNFRGMKPTKKEVGVAKNYLNKQELVVLNNLIEQYLVFAEGQALQRVPMYMKDWIDKLNAFLQINDKDILTDAGKISHELALEIAEKNFDEYQKIEAKQVEDGFDEFAEVAIKTLDRAKKRE